MSLSELSRQMLCCVQMVAAQCHPRPAPELTRIGRVIEPVGDVFRCFRTGLLGDEARGQGPREMAKRLIEANPAQLRLWEDQLVETPRVLHRLGELLGIAASSVRERIEAADPLDSSSWVREALELGPQVVAATIDFAKPIPANQRVTNKELAAALHTTGGNRNAAARIVGLSEQAVTTRIDAAEGKPDHDLHPWWKPRRPKPPDDAALALILDKVGGLDNYELAAERAGYKSPNKVLDRVWSSSEDSPLRRHWREKRERPFPPKVTEAEIADKWKEGDTQAAAAPRLGISKSSLSRRVRTSQHPDLMQRRRPKEAPHPGQKATADEIIEALDANEWNRRAAARWLQARGKPITSSGIEQRLLKAKPGSALKLAQAAWDERRKSIDTTH